MKTQAEIAPGPGPVPPGSRGVAVAGALAIGLGAVPIALSLDLVEGVATNVPSWVLASIGTMFGIAGAWCLASALGTSRLRYRTRAARKRHPEQPELQDYPWPPNGIADRNLADALRGVFGAILLTTFLLPMWWWAESSSPPSWPRDWIAATLAVLAAIGLGVVAWRLSRAIRFGRGRLHLPNPVIAPGSTTTAHLIVPGDITDGERVAIELRFVEERWENGSTNGSTVRQLRRHKVWKQTTEWPMPHGIDRGLKIEVPLALPPERSELVTELSTIPPRYWEIEIRIARTGIDYFGVFPLPVYRSASAANLPEQLQPA